MANSLSTTFSTITQALYHQGYVILPHVLPNTQLQQLRTHLLQQDQQSFKKAGIGRQQNYQLAQDIRTDQIMWLENNHDVLKPYFNFCEQLRLHLNRELFLGLKHYECHYACYQPGTFYRKHVDAFRGQGLRRISSILYLTQDWQPDYGGQLVLYKPEHDVVLHTIQPDFGTMVLFLSEEFPHEVKTVHKLRHSLTGWFRTA